MPQKMRSCVAAHSTHAQGHPRRWLQIKWRRTEAERESYSTYCNLLIASTTVADELDQVKNDSHFLEDS